MARERTDLGSVAAFAQSLHGQPSEIRTVERVLEFAAIAVGAPYAGVLFATRDGIETVAATDPLVEKVDALQTEAGEGPDLDMLDDRLSVLVSDTEADRRWPRWAEAVAGLGVRSLLGVRLHTSSEIIGTLNVYSPLPDAFTDEDQGVLHAVAQHAAVALAATRKEANLWKAIDARKLVGQAQGILMERFDLDTEQAFAVLVRYSQTTNTKLAVIAEDLVSTRRLPGADR